MRKKLSLLLGVVVCLSMFTTGCRQEPEYEDYYNYEGATVQRLGSSVETGSASGGGEVAVPTVEPDEWSSAIPTDRTYAWPAVSNGLLSILKPYDQVDDWDEYNQDVMAAAYELFDDIDVKMLPMSDDITVFEFILPGWHPEMPYLEMRDEGTQWQLFEYRLLAEDYESSTEDICAGMEKYIGWAPAPAKLRELMDAAKEAGGAEQCMEEGGVFLYVQGSTMRPEEWCNITVQAVDASDKADEIAASKLGGNG